MIKVTREDLFILLEFYAKNSKDNPEMNKKDIAKQCIKEFMAFMESMKGDIPIIEILENIANKDKL